MSKLLKRMLILTTAMAILFAAGCGTKLNTDPEDKAADFELQKLDGEQVTLADTEGQIRLLFFFFSNCTTGCLPTTQLLSKVQEQLKQEGLFGEKASILSITFDPERDTPERLAEFSGYYNADPNGWHFLRGEEQYSRDLALQYGVNVIDPGDGQFIHQNIILMVNQEGFIQTYYNANDIELDAEKIVSDIKDLL